MAQYLKQIAQGSDDGWKGTIQPWDAVSFFFMTLGVTTGDFAQTYTAALRFQNINIVTGTISTAYLRLRFPGSFSLDGSIGPISIRIYGIDEDNTDTLTSDPTGRTKTTAFVDWTVPITAGVAETFTSPDLSSIIQEIIDRPGWESGNAIGFIIEDNGSSKRADFLTYEGPTENRPQLEINYTGTTTTPQIITPKARIFNSEYGIKVVKSGFPLNTTDPSEIIFDSNYDTLKYYTSGTVEVNLPEFDGFVIVNVNHNLGYYPYVECFVEVPGVISNFVPAPTKITGAMVDFYYDFYVTTTQVRFIIQNSFGLADTAYFKYFIFKNDLQI